MAALTRRDSAASDVRGAAGPPHSRAARSRSAPLFPTQQRWFAGKGRALERTVHARAGRMGHIGRQLAPRYGRCGPCWRQQHTYALRWRSRGRKAMASASRAPALHGGARAPHSARRLAVRRILGRCRFFANVLLSMALNECPALPVAIYSLLVDRRLADGRRGRHPLPRVRQPRSESEQHAGGARRAPVAEGYRAWPRHQRRDRIGPSSPMLLVSEHAGAIRRTGASGIYGETRASRWAPHYFATKAAAGLPIALLRRHYRRRAFAPAATRADRPVRARRCHPSAIRRRASLAPTVLRAGAVMGTLATQRVACRAGMSHRDPCVRTGSPSPKLLATSHCACTRKLSRRLSGGDRDCRPGCRAGRRSRPADSARIARRAGHSGPHSVTRAARRLRYAT